MLKRGATARRSAVSLRQQHGVDPVDVVLHGRLNELPSMPTQIVKIYVCSTVAGKSLRVCLISLKQVQCVWTLVSESSAPQQHNARSKTENNTREP